MEDKKETLSVIMYMYNAWSLAEAENLFGEGQYGLGQHLFNKWLDLNQDIGRFICDLDNTRYNQLINRACELYIGRRNR